MPIIIHKQTTLLLLVAITLVGCAEPSWRSSAEEQFREVERKATKEASTSAKQYAECVMISTILYQKSLDPPSDIADAIQAQCQDKLDAYEMWMATYYASTVERGSVEGQNRRARRIKDELRERMRQQAIQSIVADRMKK